MNSIQFYESCFFLSITVEMLKKSIDQGGVVFGSGLLRVRMALPSDGNLPHLKKALEEDDGKSRQLASLVEQVRESHAGLLNEKHRCGPIIITMSSPFPGSSPIGDDGKHELRFTGTLKGLTKEYGFPQKSRPLLTASANGVDVLARTAKNCRPNKFYCAFNARCKDIERARAASAYCSENISKKRKSL